MADNINPSHYKDSCSLECIETMLVAFGYEYVYYFCLINAYKYMWRYKNKNGEEDVRKAEWYLNKAKEIYDIHENASLDYKKLIAEFELLENIKAKLKKTDTEDCLF